MANGFIISNRRNDSAYRLMLQNVKDGELIKVRNGVYATVDNLAAGMIDIEAIVPGGILCLYSAWHYYGMTTQIPDAFYVAIDRKRKIMLPEILDINLVYQSAPLLNIGKTTAIIEGIEVEIYDKERCLCDAIKYRNKIGLDVMAEILNSYLSSDNRNISRLSGYAKQLRVFNILSNYLNVKI
jgi:predicted transcriptional regulator of viral defense system